MRLALVIPFALCANRTSAGHNVNQRRPRSLVHQDEAAKHVDILAEVSKAVELWQTRTNSPSHWLPSNSLVRRCEVARELHLNSLIMKAGGYRHVQHMLNLQPPNTAVQKYKEQEVRKMAGLLRSACQKSGFPPPEEKFPTQRQIRKISPTLANLIAAFPGRSGYGRLAEYIINSSSTSTSYVFDSSGKQHHMRDWGVWTSSDLILYELKKHQRHPHIMPRLCTLPSRIAGAIQRKGGAAVFAQQRNLILEKDIIKMSRFASVVRWLDEMSKIYELDGGTYVEQIRLQAENPPRFPSSQEVQKRGMETKIARCGGRRYLSLRLGFATECGIQGLRMEPFSVRLAADILDFALSEVLVSKEGDLAMPSVDYFREKGKHNLATATELLGGEEFVGRRIGLVPQTSELDESIRVIT